MSKFGNLINTKYTQLDEAVPTSTGSIGGVQAKPTQAAPQAAAAPAPAAGATPAAAAAPATAGQPAQQGAQQAAPQNTPDQYLSYAFKNIPWAKPDDAVKMFNTALKATGNVPGMQDALKNFGYDPKSGQFVFIKGQQQQAAPAAPAAAPAAAPQPVR